MIGLKYDGTLLFIPHVPVPTDILRLDSFFYNIYLIAFNASLFYFNLCLFLLLFFSLSSIPNENGNLSGPMKQISIFTAKQKKIS